MSESSCVAQQVPDGAGPAFASDMASPTTDGSQPNWFVYSSTMMSGALGRLVVVVVAMHCRWPEAGQSAAGKR